MNEVTFIDQSLLMEEPVTEEVIGSFSDTEMEGIELSIEETPLQQNLNTTAKVESRNTLESLTNVGGKTGTLIGAGFLIAILISLICYKLMKGR